MSGCVAGGCFGSLLFVCFFVLVFWCGVVWFFCCFFRFLFWDFVVRLLVVWLFFLGFFFGVFFALCVWGVSLCGVCLVWCLGLCGCVSFCLFSFVFVYSCSGFPLGAFCCFSLYVVF